VTFAMQLRDIRPFSKCSKVPMAKRIAGFTKGS